MLLRIFKTSHPLAWILIILILIIIRAILFAFFFNESHIIESTSFTAGLTHYLALNHPVTSHVLSLFIIIPSGFFFNKIAQNANLFKGIHYLLFFFFSIFSFYSPENLVITPFLISFPLTLIGLAMIFNQTKTKNSLPNIFNASFFIGLSSLIYPPNTLFFLILLISLFYLNSATWRTITVAIIGTLTPLFFHDTLVYALNIDISTFKTFSTNFFGSFSISSLPSTNSSLLLFVLLLTQIPSFFISSSKTINKIRKPLLLMLFYFGIGLVFTGFTKYNHPILFNILIIPITIIFTSFQLEVKRWWITDIVFLGLIAAITINYIQI